jgi:hypothetical protein
MVDVSAAVMGRANQLLFMPGSAEPKRAMLTKTLEKHWNSTEDYPM